jgi:hypothetical protein
MGLEGGLCSRQEHMKGKFLPLNFQTSMGEIERSTSLLLIIGSLIVPLLLGCSLQRGIAETSSVSMATDKTRYVRGEMIKTVVTNNLDIPIWYIGYPQRELVFWTIERAKDNHWHSLGFRLPLTEEGREVCRIAMYERPIGVVKDLKPHADLLYEWNQKICSVKIVSEPFNPEMIDRGRYRFVLYYSLETVKSENVKVEPWERPIELGQIKAAYSNEFVLE